MKIENNGTHAISRAQLNGASSVDGARTANAAQPTAGVHGRDQLALSEQARLLSKARAALAEGPDLRAEKVEALQQAVESGTYRVPYDKLARHLLVRL